MDLHTPAPPHSLQRLAKHSICACMLSHLSRVCLFATPWTVARQAPLSMGFPRREYWSGLPVASPRDLPNPGIEPISLYLLHWQAGSSPLAPPGRKRGNDSSSTFTVLQPVAAISKLGPKVPGVQGLSFAAGFPHITGGFSTLEEGFLSATVCIIKIKDQCWVWGGVL